MVAAGAKVFHFGTEVFHLGTKVFHFETVGGRLLDKEKFGIGIANLSGEPARGGG